MQAPDSELANWHAAVVAAQDDADMEAEVGRLTGTENRVVLCTLHGAVTRIRCFHSTQRMVDGTQIVAHSQPAEYTLDADTLLADVLAAETAWVHGATHPLHLRPQYRE